MTALDAPPSIRAYALQVRDACSDLPPGARDELLEDLDEHLADVVAELSDDETLASRLGSPEAYAADLRQSAGYPEAGSEPSSRPGFGNGALARRVRSLWSESEAHPQGRVVRRYLDDLRPAWWLVRAYALVSGAASFTTSDGFHVVPHLFGSSAVGLVAVAALTWWSVRLGRVTEQAVTGASGASRRDRTRRWVIAANVVAGFCVLGLLAQVDDQHAVAADPYVDGSMGPYAPGVLTGADGQPVQNIYAFAADGTPLDDVLLYDQDGRPIDATTVWTDEGTELTPRFPLTADGTTIKNRYPAQFDAIGPDGRRVDPPGRPNLAVPRLEEDEVATTTAPVATTTEPAPTTTTTKPATTTAPPTTKPGG